MSLYTHTVVATYYVSIHTYSGCYLDMTRTEMFQNKNAPSCFWRPCQHACLCVRVCVCASVYMACPKAWPGLDPNNRVYHLYVFLCVRVCINTHICQHMLIHKLTQPYVNI